MIMENELVPYETSEIPKGDWLVFAPHPDDEIIGMGGSLVLAKQKGYRVILVIVTDGNKGGDKNIREVEAKKVANKLGIEKVIFLLESDRNIILNGKLIEKVTKIIDNSEVDNVFFPSPLEIHPDHRVTTELVWSALKLSITKPNAFSYEISVQNQINFLVDISSVIKNKIDLLSLYQSQLKQNNYIECMTSMNKLRTYTLTKNIEYAEGFYYYGNNFSLNYQKHLETNIKAYFNKNFFDNKAIVSIENQKNEILISVIITCFNDGKYILEAISSVKNQTHKNIEIIIVDDASSDKETINILNNLKEKKFKVINMFKNKGVSNARNIGILNSKGKYIFPLDADDKIAPTYLEKAENILNNNSDIGIVYSKAELFGLESGIWNLKKYSMDNILRENMIFNSALFRKKDWVYVGGYNNMRYGYEDYDFWLSLLNLNLKVYQIEEILFFYRKRTNSRSKELSNSKLKIISSYLQIFQNQYKLYLKNKKIFFEQINRLNLLVIESIEEKNELIEKLEQEKSKLREKKIEIKNLKNEIILMILSRSWKITKPIRKIKKLIYKS